MTPPSEPPWEGDAGPYAPPADDRPSHVVEADSAAPESGGLALWVGSVVLMLALTGVLWLLEL